LWLYAITQGIGSAREIARLVKTDVAFRWIVGDVTVGHHKLSDFRVGHRDVLVPPADNARSIEDLKRRGEAPEVIAWRERMETPEAKDCIALVQVCAS